MIRVLTVDDHPALRAGLQTVLRAEPGIVPVGAADSGFELWPLVKSTSPDVVILDFHLPGSNALTICRRLKAGLTPPRVLVYSAYAGPALVVPAMLAGADGLLSKSVPARDLYDAIRTVASERSALPPLEPEMVDDALRRLDASDQPLVRALLDGAGMGQAAAAAGMSTDDASQRLEIVFERLQPLQPEPATRG